MNLKELRQLISDGESSRMEFKHSTGQRSDAANAFCHRDYAAHGGAVSVAMYDDRLEITNPGELHKVSRSLLEENAVAYTILGGPQSRLQKMRLSGIQAEKRIEKNLNDQTRNKRGFQRDSGATRNS